MVKTRSLNQVRIAALVLLVFVLSIVSSVLNAGSQRSLDTVTVCTSSGLVQISLSTGLPVPASGEHRAGLDCPLCGSCSTPPSVGYSPPRIDPLRLSVSDEGIVPLGSVLDIGPPLPARGPPTV